MPNLDLVPTEGLLQALKRRFDHRITPSPRSAGSRLRCRRGRARRRNNGRPALKAP